MVESNGRRAEPVGVKMVGSSVCGGKAGRNFPNAAGAATNKIAEGQAVSHAGGGNES